MYRGALADACAPFLLSKGAWPRSPPMVAASAIDRAMTITSSWPAAIYLLRHGEKPADENDHGLTEQGWARAAMLADFLSTADFGPPSALFATKTSHDGGGVRTQETLAPLAMRLELDVETPFGKAVLATYSIVGQSRRALVVVMQSAEDG